MSLAVIVFLIVAAIFAAYMFFGSSSGPGISLPPGPKGYPLIGNLFDIPKEVEWVTYREWGRQYDSDVIHLNLAGQSVVVLNSWKAVNDLMIKRSNLYSSRPIRTMVNDLMGWNCFIGFMAYGERWRQYRMMFSREYTPSAARRFYPQQTTTTHNLLNNLLETPDDWANHFSFQAGQFIMSVAYGIDVKGEDDMFLGIIKKAVAGLDIAARPGAFLCDVLPILKNIPNWAPGSGFKRQAQEWRYLVEQMKELPFKAAKDMIASGKARPSFTSYLLESFDCKENNVTKERIVKEIAAANANATDSNVTVLLSFVLAMVWYPEVQKKAQEELDTSLGKDHLPDFSDKASLPYCSAILKELLRWRPVTPVAVPRKTATEDVYKGYRIPSSSVVIPNVWAILHDEHVYPEPDIFRPERFLKDGRLDGDVMDPATLGAFGFGRRICPGRFLALDSLWITVTSILATMDISKAVDEHGSEIQPSGEMQGGTVHSTIPFKCSIIPRSVETARLIRLRV